MIIIGQVSDKSVLENRFEAQCALKDEPIKNFTIQPGSKSLVISSREKHKIISLDYGLIPFWTSSSKKYFEAPVEGYILPSGAEP